MSDLKKRIVVAVLLGVLLVGGSFWLSRGADSEPTETSATAVAIIGDRKHIPVTDSNQDGVPDWQANLIPGDPIYIDATSSENTIEIPDNVTGRFTQRFFSDVLVLDHLDLLEESQDQLVRDSISHLETETEAPRYTRDDLENIITTNDPGALRAYGNLVAGNILHYQTTDDNELTIYHRLTRDENPKHLERLAVIEKQYDDIINALLRLEVPDQYTYEHLLIINQLSELRENVIGMQQYFDDPFYTLMRYRRVSADVLGMNDALTGLYNTLYLEANVTFNDNDILPVLVNLLQQE